jgi:(p)ppGpp synthase/HD superfamily hydrolase
MALNEADIRAKTLARIAHAGQKYGKEPYFEAHIEKVVAKVENDPRSRMIHVVVAYLHDIVEDTAVTLTDLHVLGFSTVVTSAVDAITRRDGESYDDYILRVMCNDHAMLVKYHDLNANINKSTKPSLAKRNLKYANRLRLEMAK